MHENIEIPSRGYDTRDVEAMTRALAAAEGGSSRKLVTVLVLCVAVVGAALLIAIR